MQYTGGRQVSCQQTSVVVRRHACQKWGWGQGCWNAWEACDWRQQGMVEQMSNPAFLHLITNMFHLMMTHLFTPVIFHLNMTAVLIYFEFHSFNVTTETALNSATTITSNLSLRVRFLIIFTRARVWPEPGFDQSQGLTRIKVWFKYFGHRIR